MIMQLRKLAYLTGAIMLCACLTGLQAEPRPDTGWRAKHLLGDVDPAAIRDEWFEERALYLVRLSEPALALYRADESQLMSDDGAGRDTGGFTLQSESARGHLDRLDAERENMLDTISSYIGRSIQPRFVYRLANNGFAAEMTPAEAETIAGLPGVRAVHRDYELELYTDAGPEWIGAPALWDGSGDPGGGAGTEGEGVVFGIIDTGIAYDNPGFAEVGPVDGYTHQNPVPSGEYLGACAPGGSNVGDCNDKLIGMYAYDDLGGDPVDTQSHGSHVASTAAGNHVEVTVGEDTVTIKGVAPHGNIISYNACCMSSTLAAAMEDVLTDYDTLNGGVDDVDMVVNYSIGADVQLSPWDSFTGGEAFRAMREAGIFVAVAAGNAGPGEATIGTPAVAPWVATAANSTHDRLLGATTVSVTGPGTPDPELEDINAVEAGDGPEVESFTDWAAVFAGDVDAENDLACEPFDGTPFEDAVAVIRRGDCAFQDKLANASDAGALFVLMVNNEAGAPITMGFESPPSIPSAMVSQTDGENVIDWIQAETDPTLSLSVGAIVHDPEVADWLNASSSRGPVLSVPSVIGPDLAAPGTNILAAVASQDGEPGWAAFTGTSMASPHVAGSAGLMFGTHPDWTPGEIQSALMMTAVRDLTDYDGEPADILGIGAGRVDLNNAAKAGFVLDETGANFEAANPEDGGDPATLNLPAFNTGECDDSCSFTRTLTGTAAGDGVTYEVSFDLPAGMSASVDTDPYNASDGVDQDLTFTFSSIHSAEDRFGWVEFTPDDPSLPTQHMPVYLGNLFGELTGYLLEVAPGRIGEMVLYRENESGEEEVADARAFMGQGFSEFFYFSMEPSVLHPRLEITVEGYEDFVLDNDGQGWQPNAGDEFGPEIIELQRLPFGVSSPSVSDKERNSLTVGFDVTTNDWGFEYEVALRLKDGDIEQSLDSGVISQPGETESFEYNLDGLVCGTDYEVVVNLRHQTQNAEYQENAMEVSTRNCFDGDGDGTFSCSISDGSGRWDPVMPLMVLMTLAGLGLMRRRQFAVKR